MAPREFPRLVMAAVGSLVLGSGAFAQSPAWSREYSAPTAGDDGAELITVSPTGDVYVAGRTAGAPSLTAPASNALVQKYSPQGALLWQSVLDLGGDERATGIALDPASGALYAVGGTSGAVGSARPWIVWRLDPATGAVLWERTFLGPDGLGGWPRGVEVDAGGGAVVWGFVWRLGPGSEAVVLRWSAGGQASWGWTRANPGGGFVDPTSLAVDPAGGVVLTVQQSPPARFGIVSLDAGGGERWTVEGTEFVGSARVDAGSSVVCLRFVSALAGGQIEKRDAAGSLLWWVQESAVFGPVDPAATTRGLELSSNGDVVLASDGPIVARLDAAGSFVSAARLPLGEERWLEGAFRGLATAPNGDALVLARGYTGAMDGTATASRWSRAGELVWGQNLRALGPRAVQPNAVAAGAHGAIVLAGTSASTPATGEDLIVASLVVQSRRFCYGDGSEAACPCGNEVPAGLSAGCRGAGGTAARLDEQGVASLSGDTLRLWAEGLPAGGVAVVVQGSARAATPFGAGLRCVGGQLVRLYVATAQDGAVDLPPAGGLSPSARSALVGDPLAPGERRAYQVVHRGAGPCAGVTGNASNAVEVTWLP